MLVHDVSVILLEAGKSLVKKLKSEVPKNPPIMFPNSDLDCTCTKPPDSLVNFISPVCVCVLVSAVANQTPPKHPAKPTPCEARQALS